MNNKLKTVLKAIQKVNPETKNFGHPLTLEHVMKTLRKTDKDFLVNLEGTITVIGEEGASWELGQDLFHQSKEVIDFLYNLLKG